MTRALDKLGFRRARRTVVWAAGALVVSSALSAEARPAFPPIVKDVSEAPCDPPCTLCHQTNSPSAAPMLGVRPFYDTLAYNFAFVTGEEQLRLKLEQYSNVVVDPATPDADANANGVADNVEADVNGNGFNDIDDLAANINPNTDEELCDLPIYGCGASRIEPKGDVEDYGLFLGVFAAMALLFKVRRRQRR